jgi:hypothetical protein
MYSKLKIRILNEDHLMAAEISLKYRQLSLINKNLPLTSPRLKLDSENGVSEGRYFTSIMK